MLKKIIFGEWDENYIFNTDSKEKLLSFGYKIRSFLIYKNSYLLPRENIYSEIFDILNLDELLVRIYFQIISNFKKNHIITSLDIENILKTNKDLLEIFLLVY